MKVAAAASLFSALEKKKGIYLRVMLPQAILDFPTTWQAPRHAVIWMARAFARYIKKGKPNVYTTGSGLTWDFVKKQSPLLAQLTSSSIISVRLVDFFPETERALALPGSTSTLRKRNLASQLAIPIRGKQVYPPSSSSFSCYFSCLLLLALSGRPCK